MVSGASIQGSWLKRAASCSSSGKTGGRGELSPLMLEPGRLLENAFLKEDVGKSYGATIYSLSP